MGAGDESEGAGERYSRRRISHWNRIAIQSDKWTGLGRHYHHRLSEVYRYLVAPGQTVLEVGCGQGDLLASLKPSYGVGIDFSPETIARAIRKHPDLHFRLANAHELDFQEKFSVIILSDLLNDLWDVQAVLERIAELSGSDTRIIINSYNRLWQMPLQIARKAGLATPNLPQNWLTVDDIMNLLKLSGFEAVQHWSEILMPLSIPLISTLCNRYLVKMWPFRFGALTNFIVARRSTEHAVTDKEPSVSVIVPARNEAGNISQIFERTPEMGSGTELVFVEGHSRDDTYEMIQREMTSHPHRRCKVFRQEGSGKGDAVRLGFEKASGDIFMILDADLTVAPEDLPRFYEALRSNRGQFVNGVRLVYPMEKDAMRFFNLLGNKFFSIAFSWLIGQPIKDTLCGTKVLWKKHYEMIANNRCFGDFDPFGDFDLLFGAARLKLKIIEMPIRYRERTYGDTNIKRWSHGWLLLKMVCFASRRIKFI